MLQLSLWVNQGMRISVVTAESLTTVPIFFCTCCHFRYFPRLAVLYNQKCIYIILLDSVHCEVKILWKPSNSNLTLPNITYDMIGRYRFQKLDNSLFRGHMFMKMQKNPHNNLLLPPVLELVTYYSNRELKQPWIILDVSVSPAIMLGVLPP